MYKTLRPFIYRLSPEQAHHLTITLLRLSGMIPPVAALLRVWFRPQKPGPQVNVLGLNFKNPLGLAAGYDKDGLAWRGLASLGFGHIELGTVTPRPQPGNPPPRLFRLVEDQAVINRMGFNNSGADLLVKRLAGPRPKDLVLGINIGKNKTTPLEEASRDYLFLLDAFALLADYLVVNVSSPNTPGLRDLQNRVALDSLLRQLSREKSNLEHKHHRNIPLLVKLAPDLSDYELDESLTVIMENKMDGIIISNTTISRPHLVSPSRNETGGLSGAPLTDLSTEMLVKVNRRIQGRLPVIASGGVMNPSDAKRKIAAGASLVQLYTGLIYSGPGLVQEILNSLTVSIL